MTESTSPTEAKKRAKANGAKATPSSDDYVLPFIGAHVPGNVVNVGFWGGLAGAMILGVVDPPLGVLVGAGVVIARHNSHD